MNIWSEILDLFVNDKNVREILIAPNAPPLSRLNGVCNVVGSKLFSAADIAETLSGVAMRSAQKKQGDLPPAGVFCIGLRAVGRLRICHFTQRGSRILRIIRIPFDVPSIASTCADPAQAQDIAAAITRRKHRVILIHGGDAAANARFAYALLKEINQTSRQVIYIVEPTLSFLLSHNNSLVVQMELQTDVATMEEAIQNACLIEPSVIYLGDLSPVDVLPGLRRLFHTDACTLLSVPTHDPEDAIRQWSLPSALLLKVTPADDGKLRVEAASGPR